MSVFAELAARLANVQGRIQTACEAAGRDPSTVELLPISKRQPIELLRAALELGVSVLGENRVQDLTQREKEFGATEVGWHFVGSLQTNKVKQLLDVPSLVMLQSLDRLSLATALQKHLAGLGRNLPTLLQINATGEANKHGIVPEDASALLAGIRTDAPNIEVQGIMAMGPLSGDPAPVFGRVRDLWQELGEHHGELPILSMGMSHDLEAAIAAGSTMVRIGTDLFGPRAG